MLNLPITLWRRGVPGFAMKSGTRVNYHPGQMFLWSRIV